MKKLIQILYDSVRSLSFHCLIHSSFSFYKLLMYIVDIAWRFTYKTKSLFHPNLYM